MTVSYPDHNPPSLPFMSDEKINRITSEKEVENLLRKKTREKLQDPMELTLGCFRGAKELPSPPFNF